MMHWFDSLSFRGKLFLNFLISAGVLILAIVFCLTEIHQLSGQAEHVAGTVLPSLQQAGKISELRLRYRVRSLEYMLSTDPAEQTKMEASLTELDGQVSKAVADGTALAQSDAQRQLLDEVGHAVAAYRATVQAAIALRKQDDTAGADHLRQTDWVKLANALRDKTDALVKFSRQESDAATQQERHMSNAALVGGLSALAVGTLVAVLFSLWFSRRMSMRLGEAVSVTRRIAAGDLHSVLPASRQDEVGRLLTAIGEMQTALRDTIVAIRRDAEQLSTTASALTEGSTKIVGNANTQSTAASAIVESVEELTIAISQMAASMKAADRMASDADQRARRGHDDLDRLIHEITHVETAVVNASAQIKTLQTQSGRISAVANTIKGIADQTNLLALNAAIEAARAGETGRGFAVVADEVRKLAERTAQSTVEITEMIAGIQQSTELAVAGINQGVTSVEAGADLARDAGETIAALQACAGQVAQIVKESSAALALQSSASNDVTHRVEEIALHATETSDACTDSVNASTQLRDMAAHMEHAIARFQV